MFIIFGWGRKTIRNFGSIIPVKCNSCGWNSYWNLLRVRVWFTFFFIPIIPYQKYYYLECNQCKKVIELGDYQAEQAMKMSITTESFKSGQISLDVYNKEVERSGILNGTELHNKTWECFKCGIVNPNNTYKCLGCGFRLR